MGLSPSPTFPTFPTFPIFPTDGPEDRHVQHQVGLSPSPTAPTGPVRTVTGRQPKGRGAEIAAVVAAMQKLAGDKLVAPIPSD